MSAHAFVKHAGGKRQLLPELRKRVPANFHRYFEPFVGGGALFFDLEPKAAYLSDANARLVRAYRGVRDDVELVIRFLTTYEMLYRQSSETFYYELRARDIDKTDDAELAAWYIALNKTSFNGLYRVNKQNKVNTPWGKNPKATILDPENLRACSIALQGITIEHRDFSAMEDIAVRGDVVYFDCPYAPLSKTANFTAYTADGFSSQDQTRLRDLALRLAEKGVHVLLSNSSAPLIRSLYEDTDRFLVQEVSARRAINSDIENRGDVTELLILAKAPDLCGWTNPLFEPCIKPARHSDLCDFGAATAPSEFEKETVPMSTNPPARVLYASPPWPLEDQNTLSISEILRHPLPPLADSGLLLLERPSEFAEEAYQVVRHWGFRIKNELLVQDKEKTRIVLFAVRGHFLKSIDDKVEIFKERCPLIRQAELHGLLERYAKKGPYIELWGQAARKGWHVYGTVPGLSERASMGGILLRYSYIPGSDEQAAEEGNKKASKCAQCGAEYFGAAHEPCVVAQKPQTLQDVAETQAQAQARVNGETFRMEPSAAGQSSVNGVPHKPIATRGSPILSDAQKIAWIKRAVKDGILLEMECEDDVNADYQSVVDKAPSDWKGWVEEQIAAPAPIVAQEAPRVPADAVTIYACTKCGLEQSKGTIKKHDGCCASCGYPMEDSTPVVAAASKPIYARTEVVGAVSKEELAADDLVLESMNRREIAPHMENFSALTVALTAKRAIVTVLDVAGWSPDQRKEALAWASGEAKKRPEFIHVKKGRMSKEEKEAMAASGVAPTPSARKENGHGKIQVGWEAAEKICDEGEDPDHPSFYWNGETTQEERVLDLQSWQIVLKSKKDGELTAEERRYFNLKT